MYMGGSSTFVDGVLRWFHHRRHTNEDAILTQTHNSTDTHLQEKQHEFTITEDFDFTGLKLIKVPKRFHLPISSSSSSMDPTKKVSLYCPFFFLGLTFFILI